MTCGRTNHPASPLVLFAPAGYVAHERTGKPYSASRCGQCCDLTDDALCEQLPCMPDTRVDARWVYFTRAEKV